HRGHGRGRCRRVRWGRRGGGRRRDRRRCGGGHLGVGLAAFCLCRLLAGKGRRRDRADQGRRFGGGGLRCGRGRRAVGGRLRRGCRRSGRSGRGGGRGCRGSGGRRRRRRRRACAVLFGDRAGDRIQALFQGRQAGIHPVAIAVERIDRGRQPPCLVLAFPRHRLDLLRLPRQIGGGDFVVP